MGVGRRCPLILSRAIRTIALPPNVPVISNIFETPYFRRKPICVWVVRDSTAIEPHPAAERHVKDATIGNCFELSISDRKPGQAKNRLCGPLREGQKQGAIGMHLPAIGR